MAGTPLLFAVYYYQLRLILFLRQNRRLIDEYENKYIRIMPVFTYSGCIYDWRQTASLWIKTRKQ